MVEINLLPWRLQQHHYERSILLRYVLAGVLFALVLIGGSHLWLAGQNAKRAERVQALRLQMPEESISMATNQGEDSQPYFSANAILKLLSAAVNDQNVCYTQIMREQNQVTLAGSAWSLMSIHHVLSLLSASNLFNRLQLHDLMRQTNKGYLQFTMAASEA